MTPAGLQAPGMTKGAASKLFSRLEDMGLAGRQLALVQHHQLKDLPTA